MLGMGLHANMLNNLQIYYFCQTKRIHMKNRFILLLCFSHLLLYKVSQAQNPLPKDQSIETQAEQPKQSQKADWLHSPLMDRIYFGGNVGAYFGSTTLLELSPLVGYKINKDLSAGVGITYIYMNENSNSSSIYGGRVFGRYQFFDNIFAYAEYEVLDIPYYNNYIPNLSNQTYRKTITSPLVGGGYSQPLGEHAQFVIMGLWNLNQTIYSPYPNPIIRMGFLLGI